MSREKQIDDIRKIIANCDIVPSNVCSVKPCSLCKAERLYNAGYRKQEEGEWEIVKGSNGKEKMVCTNCRHQQDLASTFTYCPNCGARMGGGSE